MLAKSPALHFLCVVGARPNFMKIAPIMRSVRQHPSLSATLLHTGQHYDKSMKDAFFGELAIPEPDFDLCVGSGSHAVQTAEIMKRFEPVLQELHPDAVVVVGDVNSTIACGLVAAKLEIPVVHVEAGLRSFDRSMPEEINRVLTDQLSSLLFTTERSASENLAREGIDLGRVRFVGNVMIDTLRAHLGKAPPPMEIVGRHAGEVGARWLERAPRYGVVTLHRPSNVDDKDVLRSLLGTLSEVASDVPLAFPLHPRTRRRLEEMDLLGFAEQHLQILPALGYLEMLGLMANASVVLTDSGGVQEETTALGVPCLTLRENTERPVTVELGTNTVVGRSRERILDVVADVRETGGKAGRLPELWDGNAANRIVAELLRYFGE